MSTERAKQLRELMDMVEAVHKLGSASRYMPVQVKRTENGMKFVARKQQPYDFHLMNTPFSL